MIPQSAYTSLPQAYAGKIIEPDRIESYKDAAARAMKIKGYRDGLPCFYYHTYSVIEDRLDCDDCAYQLITYFERAIAWRLDGGHWLQQKIAAQHPVCSPNKQEIQEFELVDACKWY